MGQWGWGVGGSQIKGLASNPHPSSLTSLALGLELGLRKAHTLGMLGLVVGLGLELVSIVVGQEGRQLS